MNNKESQILLITQEECAEVIQAISKVIRFGVDSVYNEQTNRQRLTEEVGDLLCMIELMIEKNILNETSVHNAAIQKRVKLEKWSDIFDTKKTILN
jgi:NTP pyrophosphatase (non-canonical NTP hydrolase)